MQTDMWYELVLRELSREDATQELIKEAEAALAATPAAADAPAPEEPPAQ